MLPVENSLGGTIYRNIDLLLRRNVHIIGEHNFRVRHCLLALPGTKKEDIKTVISHPQALAQCEEYINNLGAVAQNESDTAGSAEMIAQKKLKGFAAVASALAAKTYGLEILDEGIEDESSNFTRFLCLERIPEQQQTRPNPVVSLTETRMKTSIVFCLNGAREPGKLFKALSTFALRDISITKIESRPMKNIANIIREARKPFFNDFAAQSTEWKEGGGERLRAKFQYLFYIDVLAGIQDKTTVNALRHLGEVCSFLRVLGCYPESREMSIAPPSSEAKDQSEPTQEAKGDKALKKKGAMTILIVGFGVFGQFLAKTFVKQGHRVLATSRSDYTALAESMGVEYKTMDHIEELFGMDKLDSIVLSVSINSFKKVVSSLPWKCVKTPLKTVVVDVLSVKIHAKTTLLSLLPPDFGILCTHPMFGPESGKNGWAGLPFMFDRVRVTDRRNCEKFVKIFSDERCSMYEMSCELHDSYAASSQFITHTTGRLLSKLGLQSTPINTKGFESLLKLIETTCKDSFDLYEGLYKHNVHSKQQLTHLRKAFDELEATLTQSDEQNRKKEEEKKAAAAGVHTSQAEVNPRVAAMKPSATIQIHSLATALKDEGKKVFSLAVGEPNDTPCPKPILKAAEVALRTGKTYYTSSVGMIELREEVCKKLKRDNGLDYTPGQIVCSNGAKQSIMQLVTALVSPSDEIIIPAPYWTSYPDICRMAGCEPVIVRTEAKDSYQMSAAQLEAAITPRTRALILCSPSNPTGSVYPEEKLKELAKVLEKYPRVFVISDEIYEYITYEGATHTSFASLPNMYERTAVVNGFSKGFAMTGFRLGYVAAPLKVAKLCAKVQGQITSCPCSISQHAGVAALRMGMKPVQDMIQDFTTKRQYVLDSLSKMTGVVCSRPMGAFYVLPQISAYYGRMTPDKKQIISDSTSFCKHLLSEYKVALVPGIGFGDDRCLRISYAGAMSDLEEAMTRLKKCLDSLVEA
mmetsp:Transcript_12792/g.24993  ORF Transcript_12792/g.24993 Transcript_12792/m.24993 type:complete len:978 (-) Transcript_12792:209-3142(-)